MAEQANRDGEKDGRPLVGIIMGSDSDLPVMSEAAKVCEEFGVPYEVTIVSAHRTPERMVEYAQAAEGRGLRVVIAGAAYAAHLPGMTASLTPLPVIGVPVQGKRMDGLDSLLSIAQMPPGIPVATMAIQGAQNAGLMAVRILAAGDDELRAKVVASQAKLRATIEAKAEKLEAEGYQGYMRGMGSN